eukprot:6634597-Prorocentrum_lima.AAC.1
MSRIGVRGQMMRMTCLSLRMDPSRFPMTLSHPSSPTTQAPHGGQDLWSQYQEQKRAYDYRRQTKFVMIA